MGLGRYETSNEVFMKSLMLLHWLLPENRSKKRGARMVQIVVNCGALIF